MLVRIHGIPFSVPDAFSAGHTLTFSEAKAMNAVVADNLRRLLATRLAPTLAAGTPAAYQAAAAKVVAYAADYKLTPGPATPSPLERLVLALGPEGLMDFWAILACPVGAKVLRSALEQLAARQAAGATTLPDTRHAH